MVLDVYENNFDQIVLESEKPVIVDFWARWCKPCKMMEPLFKNLALENTAILFVKVNIEDNPILASDFEVTSIPCFISFKAGTIHKTMLGTGSASQILSLID